MNKDNPYEQQRLVHCEYCGGLYAQYVEHDYPMCDECLAGELADAVRAAVDWEEISLQLEADSTDRHPEQD